MQATAQVIEFRFDTNTEVRVTMIDDEPWFVAADVCRVLEVANTTQALQSLDDDERSMFNIGRQGRANIINESGLYTLILRSRDAVNKGSKAHTFRKWVTAEVLPAIRRTGRYEDSQNKMATLVDELIGMTEVNVIKGLIRDKAKVVPIDRRRGFQLAMHNRLHTRFNVPRVELIPAQQFEAACNFVAAYALDGEWLPKEEKGGTALTDHQLYDVYFLCCHFKALYDIFNNYKLYSHFSGIGSPVGAEMIDHVRDGFMGYHKLQELAPELVAVQKRLRLNEYRTA